MHLEIQHLVLSAIPHHCQSAFGRASSCPNIFMLWYILIFLNIYLFIFGCAGSSLVCKDVHCGEWGYSSCCAQACQCSGCSCCGAQAWGGARPGQVYFQQLWLLTAQVQSLWLRGLALPWLVDLAGPEIKPLSPALAGRLLTTGPPGRSLF